MRALHVANMSQLFRRIAIALASVLVSCGQLLAQGSGVSDQEPAKVEAAQPAVVEIDLALAVGRPVSRITFKRFEGQDVLNLNPEAVRRIDITPAIRVQRGIPLQAGDIEADREELVKVRHWFTEVRVVTESEGDQPDAPVRVTYICRDPLIASLNIRSMVGGFIGDAEPEDRYTVLSALTRHVGDAYSVDVMDRDLRERLFKGDGRFIDAREERAYRADGVHVTVVVFPAQLVDRMVFTGIRGGDAEDLRTLTGLDSKSHAGAATVRGIRQAVIDSYLKLGYPYCDVTPVMVVIPANPGRRTLVEANPVLRPDEADEILKDSRAGETVLALRIDEGPLVKVAGYEFEGIERLVDIPGSDVLQPGKLPFNYWPLWYALPYTDRLDRVQRGLQAKLQYGPTIWSPSPPYVMEQALQDATFLRTAFRKAGWLDAAVTFAGVRSNEDRSRVVLRYAIDTGPLYVLSAVAIRVETRPFPNNPKGPNAPQAVDYGTIWDAVPYAATRLGDDEARDRVGDGWAAWLLETPVTYAEERWTGDPLDPTKAAIVRKIREEFGKLGYSNLGIELEPQFAESGTTVPGAPEELLSHPGGVRPVLLRVRIDQRQKYRIGEIIIRGNSVTKTSVIRRHLRLYPGDILDAEALELAAFRLRRENWFDQKDAAKGVRIQPSYRLEPSDPDSEFLDADIIVDVIEGETGAANFSAAFSPGSGFAFSVSVTKRNFDILNWRDFTGAGQFISAEVEPPIAQRERYTLTFGEPFMFGYPISGNFRIAHTEQDFGAWTRGETGGRIQLGYTLYRNFSLGLAYQNFRNQVKDVDPGAAFEIRRDEGVSQFAAMSLEGVYNTLNNPLFPSAGWKFAAEALLAGQPFGGTYNLWRLTMEGVRAFHIHDIDDNREISLTLNAISVYQQPWGKTTRIPLAQRQFLGSISEKTALRGFENNGVGPSADEDALGGNFLVNASAQLNIEIESGFFWLVGFLDAGELVPELENFDPSGITASYGFGIRIQLPIFPQPFGLDFGWPLYDQPGNRRQVVALNLALRF